MEVIMKVMLVLAALLNIFTTGRALGGMLMMIRALQIILHLPMFRVLFPGNVLMVFTAIRPIIAFDVLDLPFL